VNAPRVQHRTFESAEVRTTVSYHVYTPAIYDSATVRRFPVIYWLHGSGGSVPAPFVARLDSAIRAGTVPPVLVVFRMASATASGSTRRTATCRWRPW